MTDDPSVKKGSMEVTSTLSDGTALTYKITSLDGKFVTEFGTDLRFGVPMPFVQMGVNPKFRAGEQHTKHSEGGEIEERAAKKLHDSKIIGGANRIEPYHVDTHGIYDPKSEAVKGVGGAAAIQSTQKRKDHSIYADGVSITSGMGGAFSKHSKSRHVGLDAHSIGGSSNGIRAGESRKLK